MEQRYNDYRNGKMDMRTLHPMVYDANNVAFALRQLSQSGGRMALGPDGTNIKTLALLHPGINGNRERPLAEQENGLCAPDIHSQKQRQETSPGNLLYLGQAGGEMYPACDRTLL